MSDLRPIPDEEEQEALDCLRRYMDIAWHRWQLRVNSGEQAAAIHVLQGAIIQHMLHRVEPEHWSTWYEAQDSGHGVVGAVG